MTADGPLAGARVVVTRPQRQAAALAASLRRHGADPVCVPTIRFDAPRDVSAAVRALQAPSAYDWTCFTSQNGVRFARRILRDVERAGDALPSDRVAAVGPATRREAESAGWLVDFVPSPHLTRELGRQLPDVGGARVVLLRAQVASTELPRLLRRRGARVDDVAVYRTVPDPNGREVARNLSRGPVDWILFTSPSTVAAFVDMAESALLSEIRSKARVAAIGPVTAAAAEEHGFTVAVSAGIHTAEGLVDALLKEAASHS